MADAVLEGCTYERPRSALHIVGVVHMRGQDLRIVGIHNVGMMKRVYPTHHRQIFEAIHGIDVV